MMVSRPLGLKVSPVIRKPSAPLLLVAASQAPSPPVQQDGTSGTMRKAGAAGRLLWSPSTLVKASRVDLSGGEGGAGVTRGSWSRRRCVGTPPRR